MTLGKSMKFTLALQSCWLNEADALAAAVVMVLIGIATTEEGLARRPVAGIDVAAPGACARTDPRAFAACLLVCAAAVKCCITELPSCPSVQCMHLDDSRAPHRAALNTGILPALHGSL